MNQYKKLLSNTMILTIGSFSSKILVFFMVRFYTAYLTPELYNTADLIQQTANIIMTIAAAEITKSVIRYGLDKSYSKHEVFSIGLAVVLIGFGICALAFPLVNRIPFLSGYGMTIYIYVLTANLQALCGQFTRARGHVKLYAFDGIFRTATTVLLNILFLAVFQWGVDGYIYSIILSNVLSAVGLFLIDNQYRFIHIRAINRRLLSQMLKYAIPLIPTTLSVWVFSVSDRYFVRWMIPDGGFTAGLYSFSNKIPTILVIISGIFIEAWQMSIINRNSEKEQEAFFSKVGNVYQSFLFVLASGIIMTSKLSTMILGDVSYYDAWRYIPLLIFGTTFACLSNFQNSIYTLKLKSVASMLTALFGASLNLLLNYLLIPPFGANGAAFATLICYILMFLVRAVHSRTYLKVHWNVPRFAGTFLLLCLQSFLMLHESPYWITQQIAFFILITYIGAKDMMVAAKTMLRRS